MWLIVVMLTLGVSATLIVDAALLYTSFWWRLRRARFLSALTRKFTGATEDYEALSPHWAEFRSLLRGADVEELVQMRNGTFPVTSVFGLVFKREDPSGHAVDMVASSVAASSVTRALDRAASEYRYRLNPIVFWGVWSLRVRDRMASLLGVAAIVATIYAAFAGKGS